MKRIPAILAGTLGAVGARVPAGLLRHAVRCALLVVLVAPVAACAGDALTSSVAVKQVDIKASQAEVAAYVVVLDDITQRLVPALTDQTVAHRLTGHITALTGALQARDGRAARAAYQNALAVIETYRVVAGADAEDAADVEGIHLQLLLADALIG